MKTIKILFVAVITILLSSFFELKAQTVIPPGFFGLNAWMPDYIGGSPSASPGPTCCSTSTNPAGLLYNFTNTAFSSSTSIGIKTLRYGGITHDLNLPTVSQYTTFVTMCNTLGITPVIQLSFSNYYWLQGATNATTAVSNATAAILSTSLVTILSGSPYNVKYYSIGNEPDGYTGSPYNISSTYSISPATLLFYFKRMSDRIKTDNPNAIIIGPDLSWTHIGDPNTSANYINGLIFGTGDITDNGITGKPVCDIFAWHSYPYPGSQTRSDVIGQPTAYFASDLNTIRNRLNSSAAYPNRIKLAVTEMNINTQNNAANTYSDQSCNSFLAGQWMAEMYATALNTSTTGVGPVAFMMPWSLHESNGDATKPRDLSLINGTNTVTPQFRSTYYHTQMMTQGFNAGTFRMGSVNTNTNVKVFSTFDCYHLAIMILNQESLTAHTVSINHAGTYPTNGTVNAKLNITPTPSWSNFTVAIGAKESILLIFDACHNLKKQYIYNETLNSTYSAPTSFTGTANRYCKCPKTVSSQFPTYTLRCADSGESGDVHYNSVTLSADTRIKDSAFVTGALTVPNGITLTIDTAEVTFARDAKIVVQSGGKLKITGSNMHACAGEIWSGIQVTGNNTVSQLTITASHVDGASLGVGVLTGNTPLVTDNVFTHCTTGIKFKEALGYTISGNEFSDVSVCIKTASTLPSASTISENIFFQPDTAILSKDAVHSSLDINCNGFIDYKNYAIYATGGTLKQQGTSDHGAGNFFSSTSTQINHQLYFTGVLGVTYYCDPSNTFTLSSMIPGSPLPRALTATVTVAAADGICDAIDGRLANHGITRGENNNSSSDLLIKTLAGNNSAQLLDCIPNPTSGKITFVYTLAENSGSAEIWIRNLYGETISKLSLAPSSRSVETNLVNLNSGIYFYSLVVNDKIINSKKLVITK